MKIKADWQTYLHDLRREEANRIFENCPENTFNHTLEIGAGDGFLSQILSRYTENLICTEINEDRLCKNELSNVRYQTLDAEKISEAFAPETFDLVFSSNLLEHLPNADKTLRGIHSILIDNGISIHVLPNRTWKITTVLCYIPNRITLTIDKLMAGRLFKRRPGHKFGHSCKAKYGGNNQKIGRKKQSRLTKLFLPPVHGISDNTFREFQAFGEKRWIQRFESAGFDIVATKKMPFTSGYGFGFKHVKKLMEQLGLSSGTAFVICKRGYKSKYQNIWIG